VVRDKKLAYYKCSRSYSIDQTCSWHVIYITISSLAGFTFIARMTHRKRVAYAPLVFVCFSQKHNAAYAKVKDIAVLIRMDGIPYYRSTCGSLPHKTGRAVGLFIAIYVICFTDKLVYLRLYSKAVNSPSFYSSPFSFKMEMYDRN